jgi:hypothetical protein
MKIILIIVSLIFLSGCARPDLSKPIRIESIVSYGEQKDILYIKYTQSTWADEFRAPASWAGKFEVGKEYYIRIEPAKIQVENN